MEMLHCPNCGQMRGFKRSLGFGTFFAVILTLGLWLFVIPLYPARCVVCGTTRQYAVTHDPQNKGALIASLVLAGVVLLVVMWMMR
jgi:hypothetical protein